MNPTSGFILAASNASRWAAEGRYETFQTFISPLIIKLSNGTSGRLFATQTTGTKTLTELKAQTGWRTLCTHSV